MQIKAHLHQCVRAWSLQVSPQPAKAAQPAADLGLATPRPLQVLSKVCSGSKSLTWCVGKACSSGTGNATGFDLQHGAATKVLWLCSLSWSPCDSNTLQYRLDTLNCHLQMHLAALPRPSM